ncbi:unnamed protein product [Linum tenue]|uniref:Uncharacterized protein n=1 Tax=Linum tenue TaxID=586396 RepID=A0AAV0Q4C2_9ROSI|nr:unnamed protein product [Linum tenue]
MPIRMIFASLWNQAQGRRNLCDRAGRRIYLVLIRTP